MIRYEGTRRYVQGIPFNTLSIGAYEDTDLHTVGSNIWIQSDYGRKLNIWYRLTSPAPEYMRYYETFLWLADLSKHTIDYLNHHQNVSLNHFKSQFYRWLQGIHGADKNFQDWCHRYKDTNFCRAITSHCMFLYDQFRDLQLSKKYESHPMWGEIDWVDLKAVPSQVKNIYGTIVTPFVFNCFEHLPWARFLKPKPLASSALRACHQKQQDNHIHLEDLEKIQEQHDAYKEGSGNEKRISIGDVISIYPDKATNWKSNDDLWYGYVQGIRSLKKGPSLDLIWIYRSSDTACQKMKYPLVQELFLSDHCNCSDYHIYADEVVSRHVVSFSASPNPKAEFFIRQKYVVDESAWVSLKKSDFRCKCGDEKKSQQYQIGDTVLVAAKNKILEPVALAEKAPDGRIETIRVRRLLRKNRDFNDKDAEPNELVYTERFEVMNMKDIHRPCHVRFYTKDEKDQNIIPAQYRRRGTADFYYIISQLLQSSDTELAPISKPWPPFLNQGWDPLAAAPQQKMRGLDIFCGGGNLGRGLEEGGAVKFDWAVDYFKEALHTYRANIKDPGDTKFFCGSVNDYLSEAMDGSSDERIAPLGLVEMISAGSPCQGFSTANQWKGNDQALLNISMVASVVSFVDFYRPKYALLENVTGMAKCGAKDDDSNVFAQVLCAFVGMGYQVRPFILDAWAFGSPQSRTRLFISITAPGLAPMSVPPQSHSHPESIRSRSLGKTANGLPFGIRLWDSTPFHYVTIEDATKDLPTNHDGRTDCIPFPDHRPCRNLTTLNRVRISCIPRFPYGMNFVKASMLGLMPPPQMESCNWNADRRNNPETRAWKRVIPNTLIPTVTTSCQPEDGICGAWVHWDACRCITVMEVRRAQGFPDDEVIIGAPRTQWKIIGNSVARTVALALGMALRSAWLINMENSIPVPPLNSSLVSTSAEPRPRTVIAIDIPIMPEKRSSNSRATFISRKLASRKPHTSTTEAAIEISDDDIIYIATRKRGPSASPPLCRTPTEASLSTYSKSVISKRFRFQPLDTTIESRNSETSRSKTTPPVQMSQITTRETQRIEPGAQKRGRDRSDGERRGGGTERSEKRHKRWEGRLGEA